MNKIEKLIKEMCPSGVEYKELGKVCDLYYGKGNNIPKDGGQYPVYGCNGVVGYTSNFNNENTAIVGHIGSAGLVSWGSGKHYVTYNGTICKPLDKNKVNSKYIYNILCNLHLEKKVKGSQPFLSVSDFNKILIPVPPIEIQNEIVKILDKFVELDAELEAELEARKKQYDFYRGKLMNSKTNLIELSKLGKISMCKRIMKNQTSLDGDIPFYKIGTFGKKADAFITKDLFEEYKSKFSYPKKGDILISCSGTIGRTVVFDGIDSYYQDSNIVWIENDESLVSNKYLYYFYQTFPWKISTGGTIARLYNSNIEKTKIHVPSLEEQQQIVNVLDRFDKLINDIKEGLPAEIEMRRSQYEYYRNKLLSFEELYNV